MYNDLGSIMLKLSGNVIIIASIGIRKFERPLIVDAGKLFGK